MDQRVQTDAPRHREHVLEHPRFPRLHGAQLSTAGAGSRRAPLEPRAAGRNEARSRPSGRAHWPIRLSISSITSSRRSSLAICERDGRAMRAQRFPRSERHACSCAKHTGQAARLLLVELLTGLGLGLKLLDLPQQLVERP
eukprot:6522045-Prymnesium_polylepis.1